MPRKGKGHGNETRASERHRIQSPREIQKPRGRSETRRGRPTTPTAEKLTPEEKREREKSKRADFARAYYRARVTKETAWADEEKELLQKYGKFGYHFPKACHDKLLARGDLYARKSTGRPRVHDDDVIIAKIREARNDKNIPGVKPHRLSARRMATALQKDALLAAKKARKDSPSPSPGKDTIARRKKELGFNRLKRKKKPLADGPTRAKRLAFATENDGFDFTYWLVVDEKIFTADKHKNEEIEARSCSPLQDFQRYFAMAAETATQLKKRMFLVGMTEGKKVGHYEVDCTA